MHQMHCIGIGIGRAAAGSRSEKNLYCSSLKVEFCGQESDNSIFWDSHQVTLGLLSDISIHIPQKFYKFLQKRFFIALFLLKLASAPPKKMCDSSALHPKNHRFSSTGKGTTPQARN